MVLGVLTGWLDRREREAVAYLIEENRLLRRQLGTLRPRLTNDDRRQLAARAYRVGRAALQEIATIATPDTLLRWHRQPIARKWSYARRPGRRGVLLAIRRLVVRMAEENPTWGYTRIQGALKNVGHCVGRSTIRRILKAVGLPPVPQRPTSWQTFLNAHWGVIAGADFFTTEVWTWQGLVTYYTVFVIDPAALQIVLGALTGWLNRREREAVAYLIEENRLLRRQLGTRRPRLTDDDRRRLAARAYRVGRAALREIATIATPDTLLSCGWRKRIRRGGTRGSRAR